MLPHQINLILYKKGYKFTKTELKFAVVVADSHFQYSLWGLTDKIRLDEINKCLMKMSITDVDKNKLFQEFEAFIISK